MTVPLHPVGNDVHEVVGAMALKVQRCPDELNQKEACIAFSWGATIEDFFLEFDRVTGYSDVFTFF